MKNQNRSVLILIFAGGLIIIMVLFFLLNLTFTRPEATGELEAAVVPTNYPAFEVPRVGLQEAKSAFDAGDPIIIDVRSPSSYEESHIPGAVSVPLTESDYEVDAPRDALIFTYCT